ncbi:shikimate kinase [Legionella cardiaca]|uniref:Shikimate kinase n=1 Tax=Legionella cardiaca TaxID=1071983 RepID=A0ABY8AMJ7_9GAMM|nr:shikimate kinase [Legionella cardiaca]WED41798.1 shikimate kinase [Legionella cardiaca]
MNPCKRIFIVGQPGAGKALVAKKLAEKLGWEFIDADFGLEFRAGRNLRDLLGSEGHQFFYDCESTILSSQLQQENIVVATDGSIVCSEKNRELLLEEFVVFIDVSTSVQLERTARHPTPLLPVSDLKQFLDNLHQERDNFYEQVASLTIDSDDNELEQHLLHITKEAFETNEIKSVAVKLTLDKKDLTLLHRDRYVPIHLSEQQASCLKLLAQGKSSKNIAREMNISFRTVEGNIAKTMELLGCTSSKELIALYHNNP